LNDSDVPPSEDAGTPLFVGEFEGIVDVLRDMLSKEKKKDIEI